MGQQGIRELVGRLMIDPDFLAELVRAPETVLAQYSMSHEERAAVLQAVAKLGSTPPHQHARLLKTALVKRWAT
jgi:hypothetical protein